MWGLILGIELTALGLARVSHAGSPPQLSWSEWRPSRAAKLPGLSQRQRTPGRGRRRAAHVAGDCRSGGRRGAQHPAADADGRGRAASARGGGAAARSTRPVQPAPSSGGGFGAGSGIGRRQGQHITGIEQWQWSTARAIALRSRRPVAESAAQHGRRSAPPAAAGGAPPAAATGGAPPPAAAPPATTAAASRPPAPPAAAATPTAPPPPGAPQVRWR